MWGVVHPTLGQRVRSWVKDTHLLPVDNRICLVGSCRFLRRKKKRGWNPERKVGNVPLLPMWRITCEGIQQNITDGAGLLAGKRSWTLSHQWISTFWSLGRYVLRRQNHFDLISYLMVYPVLKWNWHLIHLMFYLFLLAQEKCLLQKREIDFRRRNLTSVDVRSWRIKTVPAMKMKE